jgi:hypothetical protein
MRRTLPSMFLLLLAGLSAPLSTFAAGVSDFRPDPKSVQRYGPAYRYPQAGWIVLHIEGEPYTRGYQHGRLLAPEIAANLRCFAAVQSPKAPSEGWKLTRTLVNALFVRRYEKEYLEEMRGIADGASAARARFDNRPIDVVDVVALNAWPEIATLDSALNATANGLEGIRFGQEPARPKPRPKPMRCSAFAATGPATADGKIVFGHITMFSLYPSLFYNVWLDVKPAKGHRVLMQTYPAGIQSGLDYYMNDAGLLVCETTISQTTFDIQGLTVASRIRQALQYADGIDQAVAILKKGNNGLYTNEWLLADTKTNEIAMFELGTHKSKLYRSSKNEWFGGTKGFYWGCNNTKDLEVRLETVPSVKDRPANVVFHPSDRDKVWLRLFHKYQGKIDADFGKIAFTTPPIASFPSLDAKFTTTNLAKQLKTWALYGPPLGRTWQPTHQERKLYPEVRPMVSNPWAILHTEPPAKVDLKGIIVADLPNRVEGTVARALRHAKDRPVATVPAWHGTLLPKTDADSWLAAAFADYEKIYSLEKALKKRAREKGLAEEDRDRLAVALYGYRSSYLAAARAAADVPLAKTRSNLVRDEWYRIAAGKGVYVLQELRNELGDELFEKAMDSFGRENAGRKVAAAQFQAHVEKVSGKRLGRFFDYWLGETTLPRLTLKNVTVSELKAYGLYLGEVWPYGYRVSGVIHRTDKDPPQKVRVTIEGSKGAFTRTISPQQADTPFKINLQTSELPRLAFFPQTLTQLPHTEGKFDGPPLRVVINKYGRSAEANGGVFSTLSWGAEPEDALIVYGTADEVPAHREAAEALQRAILRRGSNITVPIKSDKDVTEKDLKAHHLLLIGRPDSNRIVERVRAALPVTFGSRSFVVRGKSYAQAGSAVIAAAENPFNKRYSVVMAAGLSAEATLRAAPIFVRREQPATEVLLLAHGQAPHALIVPPRDLVWERKDR